MDIILKYFPKLTERQREQFAALLPLYEEWNAQINVISRKDMEHFYEHHVLHSLAIAKVMSFAPMSEVLDVGTGGGFPGVPLAIMFPDARFTLIDSIGKKIKVLLVSPPYLWSLFSDKNENQISFHNNYVNNLLKRYDITYIDLQDCDYFSKEDFADVAHLSFKGAHKFTSLLRQYNN